MISLEQKRELRKKTTAEVFTPSFLAQQMLDKIPQDFWDDENKTLLEPSCGDGIFVVLSIKKRLQNNQQLSKSLRNTYAIDIMEDNIEECRKNVYQEIIKPFFKEKFKSGIYTKEECFKKMYQFVAFMLHNIRVTKNTLEENFDEWKTFEEETKETIQEFLQKAKAFVKNIEK